MKKLILSLALLAVVFTACKGKEDKKVDVKEKVEEVKTVANPIASYAANTTESVLTWKGTKPGGAHNGTVKLSKGLFELDKGGLKTGEFVFDLSTITCLDLEGEYKGKLEGHLKAPDFFDVAKYPTAKFAVTGSEVKEGKVNVTGNLTIKDVTKSITIPATITEGEGGTVTFKSDVFSIDRADFNVKYGSKKFFDNLKDKFIDDLMELSFEVKAKK